jgi:hypothetical protein
MSTFPDEGWKTEPAIKENGIELTDSISRLHPGGSRRHQGLFLGIRSEDELFCFVHQRRHPLGIAVLF